MQSSSHGQQSWMQCHSRSVHGTLEGLVTSQAPVLLQLHWLQGIENQFQFKVPTLAHLLAGDPEQLPQPVPQHQYQHVPIMIF